MHAPSVAMGGNENGANGANAVVAVTGVSAANVPPVPVTRDAVQRALEQHGGNRAAASRALGIGRTTLWRLMKQ
jgi:propionate catabolism operon transcriptional regulator